jgi:ATP-binding cassette subfamily B protein
MSAQLKKATYWQAIKTILPSIYKATPLFNFLYTLFMIICPVWYVLTAYVMQNLFDTVKSTVEGSIPPQSLVTMLLLAAGVQIMGPVFACLSYSVSYPIKFKVTGYLDQKIHQKAARLAALNYEDPEILDCINKAKSGAENANKLSYLTTLVFYYGTFLLAMGIYLSSLRPLLILALLFIMIPLVIAQLLKGRFFSRFTDESAPLERKMDYYERTIYSREYFKETRLLGIFGFVKELYLDTLALFSKKRWQAAKKTYNLEIFLRLLTLAGYFGVLYLLLDSLLTGYISVGAFAAVFTFTGRFFGEMSWGFHYYLGNVMESIGPIKSYVQFMNLEEQAGQDIDLDYSEGISLENVYFRYPFAKKDAVAGINLSIKPGETIALVGKNGAGKTTLVRLLLGILPPSAGQVRVGKTDLSDVAMQQLYQKTSAVFQKFQKYKMSLQDNVIISDPESQLKPDLLAKALTEADVSLDENFSEGLNTMLSREFEGIDLSGGGWQRVSLARGLYKNSDFIILDEPTSAIDPIEETRLYKKFAKIAKGKIAVIVTHRLGSAKIADRIVVLDDGKIEAVGNHEQLITAGGLYAKMYQEQAKWYAEG